MNQILARVISGNEVLPDIFLIWLEAPEIAVEAQPGQFVMVGCGGDTVLPRPFSIHQCRDNAIALLVRIAGKGSSLLSRVTAGDSLEVFGPLGSGFSILPESRNLLLVAGGLGIAPMYFLAQKAVEQGCRVTFLYGTVDKNRYSVSGIETIDITDDGSVGKKGFLTGFLPEYLPGADQVFACGPMPMYRAMSSLPGINSRPVQVSLEIMMGCGRGICNGCTIRTQKGLQKVCEDGPVFGMAEILWDKMNI